MYMFISFFYPFIVYCCGMSMKLFGSCYYIHYSNSKGSFPSPINKTKILQVLHPEDFSVSENLKEQFKMVLLTVTKD